MPLRARLKRAFGKSPNDSGSELSMAKSNASKDKDRESKRQHGHDNTYKPGEMPKPKYGGPVNKEHQKTLKAFRWPSDSEYQADRRPSHHSQYSPTASKPTSRMNSLRTSLFPQSRRPSQTHPSRMGSVDDAGVVKHGGLSRPHTHDRPPAVAACSSHSDKTVTDTTGSESTVTVSGQLDGRSSSLLQNVESGKPFQEEALHQAITNRPVPLLLVNAH